ncbi:hypothetical protein [Arhodomonas sp. AD133]|uniref:hypothetical protein n=1 Tax=Arhodomonas sp. AD133 TaxID=3415009 RepID=UPI003EBFBCDE
MYRSGSCGVEPDSRPPRVYACLMLVLVAGITTGTSQPCRANGIHGEILYRGGVGLTGPGEGKAVLSDKLVELGWETSAGLGWNLAATGWYRHEDRIEPDTYEKASIRRLELSRDSLDWSVSLGKQNVVWGKMDAFPLLDVVNPRDTREFVLDDEVRTRMPLWLGTASYYRGDQEIQVVLVPDLETGRVPDRDARFDPTQGRLPVGVELDLESVAEPDETPDNWEVGVKWTGRAGPWELSALAYRGWSNQPVYFTEISGANTLRVTPRAVRQSLFGISGDAPYGSTVWRFELLYTPNGYRSFIDANGVPVQREQDAVHAALGMDWTPNNWLIGGQVFHFEDDGEPANLAMPSGNYASGVIERYWLQRRLKLRVFTMVGLDQTDHWVTAELRYRLHGRYELTVGGDWLGGDQDGFFGQFDDGDRLTAEISVQF